jgi:hypothetical protein
MPLPEFNVFGDLPEGNHPASLAEVAARFGSGTAQRQAVTDRLRLNETAAGEELWRFSHDTERRGTESHARADFVPA